MAKLEFNYYSSVYREFRAIPKHDHRARIHFFEKEEVHIRNLHPEELFEFIAFYALALYETNDFRRFLVVVEEVLIRSIEFNQIDFQGEDVYQNMLFRKGNAHLKLFELDACNHTLKELLRISPTNPAYVKLLGKCWYHQKPAWIKTSRAISVSIFILTAIITSLEVLFVTPFTPEWTNEIQLIRNLFFSAGILLLGITELVHRIMLHRRLTAYRLEAADRKRKRLTDQSV
ncbi:MAG: hypothetical protein KDC34_20440 [Saprospiraceae bacterium]|nr:hypothetical protein [Saprospiraceae bacterium]